MGWRHRWRRAELTFPVTYHSPLTSLTIMRVARPHYRLIWGAVTLLTSLTGRPVLPRVVAVSGTIKKLQSAAVVHHRRDTAVAIAALVAQGECEWGSESEATSKVASFACEGAVLTLAQGIKPRQTKNASSPASMSSVRRSRASTSNCCICNAYGRIWYRNLYGHREWCRATRAGRAGMLLRVEVNSSEYAPEHRGSAQRVNLADVRSPVCRRGRARCPAHHEVCGGPST
jgi:hypothetical protein